MSSESRAPGNNVAAAEARLLAVGSQKQYHVRHRLAESRRQPDCRLHRPRRHLHRQHRRRHLIQYSPVNPFLRCLRYRTDTRFHHTATSRSQTRVHHRRRLWRA